MSPLVYSVELYSEILRNSTILGSQGSLQRLKLLGTNLELRAMGQERSAACMMLTLSLSVLLTFCFAFQDLWEFRDSHCEMANASSICLSKELFLDELRDTDFCSECRKDMLMGSLGRG
jgi:hypothetical protein